jgi:hypothetical protein
MDKAIEIVLSQGITGAILIIAFIALTKKDREVMHALHERLRDKDAIIERLLDNELRISQIIAAFAEMKPIMDEIKELLKRIYTKSTGL